VAAVLLAATGLASALTDIPLIALVQQRIPSRHLAKALGLWEAGVAGALAISPFVASTAITLAGVRNAFLLSGAAVVVLVAAAALGKTGCETKDELDGDRPWLARLEELRLGAARLMGLSDAAGAGLPKVALLAKPASGGTIASRYFSSATCHTAHALTGALCVSAACNVRGSVAAQIANPGGGDVDTVRIEHPSGFVETRCELRPRDADGLPVIASATIVSTARPLFSGMALVRGEALAP
jgi:2-methylaconitate cis-trans-isomerase PrpF